MLLQAIKNTLAVFPHSGLPDVNHVLTGQIGNAKQKINAALREIVAPFTLMGLLKKEDFKHTKQQRCQRSGLNEPTKGKPGTM